MNKKGFVVQDLLFMGIILIVFAIVVIIVGKLLVSYNSGYQAAVPGSSDGKTMISDMTIRFPKVFDNIFLFIVIFMAIALFFTMFMIDSHPALFFVIIILLAFGLIALAAIGNVFNTFSNSSDIASTASQFTLMAFVFNHWITILLGVGVVAIIVFFAKIRQGMFA